MLNIVIKGQPIPAKRVTRATLWKAEEYASYKEIVAWELKKHHIPSVSGDMSILSVRFYRKGQLRADLDNLLKGIMEAFEMAGVVANDRQITHIEHLSVVHGDNDPRVEIQLEL